MSVTIVCRIVSATLIWIGLQAYDITRDQPSGSHCFRVIDMQKTKTQYLTGAQNRSLNLRMVVTVAGVGVSVVGPSVGLGVVVGDSVAYVGAGNVNGANVYRMYAEAVTTGVPNNRYYESSGSVSRLERLRATDVSTFS